MFKLSRVAASLVWIEFHITESVCSFFVEDERENGIHVEESETESLNHRDFGIEESVANAPNQSTAASQSWPNSSLQNEEDSLEGAPNNWNTRVELSANEESGSKSSSREHSFTPSEVVLIEDGSKVMHEWMRSSLEKVDSNEEDGNEPSSRGQKGLLAPIRDSPSSVTTGEYFTPLASPMISEPTSEVSEDSEYRDAGDVTPVPEDFETGEPQMHYHIFCIPCFTVFGLAYVPFLFSHSMGINIFMRILESYMTWLATIHPN